MVLKEKNSRKTPVTLSDGSVLSPPNPNKNIFGEAVPPFEEKNQDKIRVQPERSREVQHRVVSNRQNEIVRLTLAGKVKQILKDIDEAADRALLATARGLKWGALVGGYGALLIFAAEIQVGVLPLGGWETWGYLLGGLGISSLGQELATEKKTETSDQMAIFGAGNIAALVGLDAGGAVAGGPGAFALSIILSAATVYAGLKLMRRYYSANERDHGK